MIQIPKPDIAALMEGGREVDESLRVAFARTVLRHRQLGQPMMIWRDGRVAEIAANLVLLDPLVEEAARR